MLIKNRMIDPDAKPWRHDPPYRRIDIMHAGRPRVINRQARAENGMREPDPAAYDYDPVRQVWILKP